MVRWREYHPCFLILVTFFCMFQPTWLHITNNWGCHLFHAGFISLDFTICFLLVLSHCAFCFIVSKEKKKWNEKKSLLQQRNDALTVLKFRNPICTIIFASFCHLISSSLVTIMHKFTSPVGQCSYFRFCHLIGNNDVSVIQRRSHQGCSVKPWLRSFIY